MKLAAQKIFNFVEFMTIVKNGLIVEYLDHGTIELYNYEPNKSYNWIIDTDCKWVKLNFNLLSIGESDNVLIRWLVSNKWTFTGNYPKQFLKLISPVYLPRLRF